MEENKIDYIEIKINEINQVTEITEATEDDLEIKFIKNLEELKEVEITKEETLNYNQLIKQLTPLDLLLFRGSDKVSDVICFLQNKFLNCGEFSHVGLVVNSELLPTVPQLKPGRWYVWESTMSSSGGIISNFVDNAVNVETGEGKFGVQIRDLEKVIDSYIGKGGKISWAALKNNPWKVLKDRKTLISNVTRAHTLYGTRTYDANVCALLGALFPCFRKVRDVFDEFLINGEFILSTINDYIEFDDDVPHDDDPDYFDQTISKYNMSKWVFCSELVAIIYQKIGVIDSDKDPRNVVPVDFLGYDVDGIPRLVDSIVHLAQDPQFVQVKSFKSRRL
jgi:hypothetical protein